MPNLGFGEILAILAVVLLLFGAKRLPEIGASMGKGIREFKRSLSEVNNSVSNLPPDDGPAARRIDSPDQNSSGTSSSGEPKRLSQ